MVNNTIFKLKQQTTKLSSKLPSSSGPVSFASDINMTVKKTDYTNAINNINYNVLSRMLINSRNYKKNISNSTLSIKSTANEVDTVKEIVDTVQETVDTVQEIVSVTGAADILTGEFLNLVVWPITYP
jgi:hypothetical protein